MAKKQTRRSVFMNQRNYEVAQKAASIRAPLRHGFVEPNEALAFDSYQKALYATQPNWTEVI